MSQFYKLTDENMQTFGGFQWELGKWVWAKGSLEQGLCSDGWIHGYEHPLLAVLFNSIHGCYEHLRMFDIDVAGLARYDGQVKCGFRGVRLAREIDVPHVTTRQRVAFGILCAKAVFKDETWNKWADNWLRGEDDDTYPPAAYAAFVAARAAADARAAPAASHAAYGAAYAAGAARAAYAAARAAYAAARAAYAAGAAYAAHAAYGARAAYAAARAAYAAARAARAPAADAARAADAASAASASARADAYAASDAYADADAAYDAYAYAASYAADAVGGAVKLDLVALAKDAMSY